jgi:hypothetical protein
MYCNNTVLSFVLLVLTLAGHALTAPASASADGTPVSLRFRFLVRRIRVSSESALITTSLIILLFRPKNSEEGGLAQHPPLSARGTTRKPTSLHLAEAILAAVDSTAIGETYTFDHPPFLQTLCP